MAQEIHIVDVTGKKPGRIASEIVRFLIGKHKPTYEPHLDLGDAVRVIHASRMDMHPKKLVQKQYYRHTEFAHGLKITSLKKIWAENPGNVLERAVSRMLPKNKHRQERLKRLKIEN